MAIKRSSKKRCARRRGWHLIFLPRTIAGAIDPLPDWGADVKGQVSDEGPWSSYEVAKRFADNKVYAAHIIVEYPPPKVLMPLNSSESYEFISSKERPQAGWYIAFLPSAGCPAYLSEEGPWRSYQNARDFSHAEVGGPHILVKF